MLDIQTNTILPFLTLNQPDPNFVPIDIAFDYNNNALYVLSIGNNQEEDSDADDNDNITNVANTDGYNNNNGGVIWKISYQGLGEGEATTSSSDNSTSDLRNTSFPSTTRFIKRDRFI